MVHEVIVVGAGVAGLALARQLQLSGRRPLVLERARGVGGRCATRRVDGQPVDHGVAYLHGRTRRFLAALDGVEGVVRLRGWPAVREGDGTPCRPEAFDGQERRFALAQGVSQLAKRLARGLDVRLDSTVSTLRALPEGWALTLASGEALRARAVALAMPPPSATALLQAEGPPPPEVARLLPLLGLVRMLPCLTVIARYPAAAPAPAWEASFPRQSAALHTLLHDSSKRPGSPRLTLVLQARPAWSRAQLAEPAERWTRKMLDEAAALHGEWLSRPEAVQSHVWRKARVDPGSELAAPVAVRLPAGEVLGFAGDGFDAAGGLEGAYLSGVALAARFEDLLGPKDGTNERREEPPCR